MNIQKLNNLIHNHSGRLNYIQKKFLNENIHTSRQLKDFDFELIVTLVYKDLLKRSPSETCIKNWHVPLKGGLSISDFYDIVKQSEEAVSKRNSPLAKDKSIENFIVETFEFFLKRIPSPGEILNWSSGIKSGFVTIEYMVYTLYEESRKVISRNGACANSDSKINLMGTNEFFGWDDWNSLKKKAGSQYSLTKKPIKFQNFFHLNKAAKTRVSAICSLYKGGDYIHAFMENITSQTGFKEYAELIIIDANSPDSEHKVIERYARKYSNIVYIRTKKTIPIYEAWNMAIKHSSGEYITNTNVDDLRASHSLITQASYLDNLKFVDVIYQDFYYSLEFLDDYDLIRRIGLKTNLPPVTSLNIMSFNSPHNAPMWRKSLHEELGYFDESFFSAGDYEFWCRCILAKKCFYKINEPHIVYYNNPKGLSTSANTKGVEEAIRATKMHGKNLFGSCFLASNLEYSAMLSAATGQDTHFESDNKYLNAQSAIRMLSKTSRE
jgi:hypothetical protein